MSLADRLRDMFSSGAGSGPAGAAAKRRARNQAQPVTPGIRSYDAPEPGRPMARAQWIGLGLAAALAVALTAALVFVIMSVIQPSSRPVPTPTALPVTVVSPTPNSSIADIFATFTPTPVTGPTATAQAVVGQRLQVAGTGNDGANLRREPGQSGERIKTIREGAVLEIIGPDRTVDGTIWRNVRDTQGESGWIAASFLAAEGSVPPVSTIPGSNTDQPSSSATIVTGAATAVPKPTSPGVAPAGASRGQVGNTNGQGANIRSEPGSGGRVLKTVAEGTNLEVLGPEREVDGQIWRQVRDSSGVTGWIIRGAVAPPGTIPTPVPPAAGPTRAPTTPQPGAQPAATQAPAAKPTSGSGAPPPAAATPRPTAVPGNLPIIIQPATPRPTGGNATPTPRP